MNVPVDTMIRNPAKPANPIGKDGGASGILFNLHLLRTLAAIAVVYHHIASETGLSLDFDVGAHGVDVFFVISGFIISYIGEKSPDHFFVRRLIRIVPFYWAATVFVFCVATLFPDLLRSTRSDVVQLVYSLFFIPRETSYAGTFPTLILGWSLNYEMYFYVLFAICLSVTKRWAPIACVALIATVFLAIHVSGLNSPTLAFYARPIIFEFCFGILAFYVFRGALTSASRFQSKSSLKFVLWGALLAAATLLVTEEYYAGFGYPRFAIAGVPAFFILLSALLLEGIYGYSAKSRFVYLFGESSYILYLIHPYIIYSILRVAVPGARDLSVIFTLSLIVLLLSVSLAFAVAVHVYFEKPILAFLRAMFLGDGNRSAAARQ